MKGIVPSYHKTGVFLEWWLKFVLWVVLPGSVLAFVVVLVRYAME